MLLPKLHNHCLSGMSCGDGFDPFSEIVSGSEDPPVLSHIRWVYFSNKIQPPLLERVLNINGLQRKWKKLPPSFKDLIFLAGINFLVGIEEHSGPIKSHPHDIVHNGLPIVMTSTFSCMEFFNEIPFLLLIYTVQQHPSWFFPIQYAIYDAKT